MLDSIFLQVINMSLTASVVILIVLAARIILRKVPKVFSYMLWAIVLFRLLCPVSLSSDVSIFTVIDMPLAKEQIIEPVQKETLEEPVTVSDNLENIEERSKSLKVYPAVKNINKKSLSEKIREYFPWSWLAGIVCITISNLYQLGKLRKKMVGAVCLRDNQYLSDYISEPFVIGIFCPKIYLPSDIGENERGYIILHEQFHIRRGDPITRTLAFIALCIHWFNPLVWLAFRLSAKDMEMSCDEAVMNTLKEDIRAEYAQSLLNFAAGRRKLAAMTLTFGESDTKTRIKNVMSWKKPAVRGIVAAMICLLILGVMLMTNPKQQEDVKTTAEGKSELSENFELTEIDQSIEENSDLSEEAQRLFFSKWRVIGVAGTTMEYEESGFESDSIIEQAVGSLVWGNPEQVNVQLKDLSIIVSENIKVSDRVVTAAQFEKEWGIDPENILLFGDEFIEVEVSAEGEFPGAKAYFADDQNAVFYFESVFFSAEVIEVQGADEELAFHMFLEAVMADLVESTKWNEFSNVIKDNLGVQALNYYCSYDLSYQGQEIRLDFSYMKSNDSLSSIYLTKKTDDSMIWIYDADDGKLRVSADEIIAFIQTDRNILNEISFELPEELTMDVYNANIGFEGGCLFLPMVYEGDSESTPVSWMASGMVSRYTQSNMIEWNGNSIERVYLYYNHVYEEYVENVEGLCAPAILMQYKHDLYTAADIAELEAEGIDVESIDTTSDYWYLYIAEPGAEYGYVITLNQKEYSKEDIINLGKTISFLER